jgi:rSAM/selenodomain-associated transferase 1
MNEVVCVVMAKQPQVGRTKTRLSPPLTFQQAAVLYEALLRDAIALVESQPGIDLAVAISPPGSQSFFTRITPPDACLLPVEGRDIGDCLSQAFSRLLNMGWRKVLALNADGPSLPPAYLEQAVQLLDEYEVVLGPALDGGYYLVGMQRPHLGIFQDVTWSTAQVLAQTLERAGILGLRVGLTAEWYDVDTVADLLQLQSDLNSLPPDRLVHTRKFLADFDQAVI